MREPLQWMVKLRGMLPTDTWSDCMWRVSGEFGVELEGLMERCWELGGFIMRVLRVRETLQ